MNDESEDTMTVPTDEQLDRAFDTRVEEALRITQGIMLDDLVAMPTGYVSTLLKASEAALHALRSYQHGNSAPDLARLIADALESAIAGARGDDHGHDEAL